MNKTTFFLLFALLTAQHTQIKTGMIPGIITVAVIAIASIVAYKALEESQKTNVDKTVDTVADKTKNVLNAVKDALKK